MMKINIFILLLTFIIHKKTIKLKYISHFIFNSIMELFGFKPS